jgi:RND family efflux transporter MFP subunit
VKFKIRVFIVVLTSFGVGAFWYNHELTSKSDATAEVIKVFLNHEVTTPHEEKITSLLTITGQIVATDTITMRAKTNGTLLKLSVKEGDFVKAGQALGEMDLSDLSSRRVERDSAIMAARHSVTQAQVQHTANISLQKSGFIAETSVTTSASALESAKAQLKAAESQMVAINKQLSESTIIAPISGFVIKRAALPGEKLAMEQEIVSIVNPLSLELKAFLNPQWALQLQSQQHIDLHVDGIDLPIGMQLSRIAPVSDSASRALPVYFRLLKTPVSVKPGMMGRAQILMPHGHKGLTVVQTAIQEEAGKTFVWIVKDGALAKKMVTLGQKDEQGERVAVIDGLDRSDVLLSMHFDGLKEGIKVTIEAEKVR